MIREDIIRAYCQHLKSAAIKTEIAFNHFIMGMQHDHAPVCDEIPDHIQPTEHELQWIERTGGWRQYAN